MDAGEGLHHRGNGHSDPQAASLPSAGGIESQPPKGPAPEGAPVGRSPEKGELPAGAPEPLVVLEEPERDDKGRFQPGRSGNPKGRPPGIPNLNTEICRAVKAFRMGDRTFLQLLLARCLQDPKYAELVIPRLFADATPPAATPGGINIHNNPQANATHSDTHVSIGEHLADAGTRRAVAELTQQLAARGAFAGEPRHVRQ